MLMPTDGINTFISYTFIAIIELTFLVVVGREFALIDDSVRHDIQ